MINHYSLASIIGGITSEQFKWAAVVETADTQRVDMMLDEGADIRTRMPFYASEDVLDYAIKRAVHYRTREHAELVNYIRRILSAPSLTCSP